MSNPGQIALTVVGTVAGSVAAYFTDNPAFIGLGMSLGNLAGQLAFPTKPYVPTAADARIMGASEGDPIKIVDGTMRIAGTVIWAGQVNEATSSGKGVPSPTGQANYYQSFALLLCEGPIVGIRRMWMDKVLVYDKSFVVNSLADYEANASTIAQNQQYDALMTVYLGDEEQTADPTMEAVLGAGNVPAHRGTAYIVFNQLDITNYGPRIPNIECEVVQSGTPGTTNMTLYAAGVIAPWRQGTNDPRWITPQIVQYIDSALNVHQGSVEPQYLYTYPDAGVENGTLDDLINATQAGNYITWEMSASGPYGASFIATTTPCQIEYTLPGTFHPYSVASLHPPLPNDNLSVCLHFNRYYPGGGSQVGPFLPIQGIISQLLNYGFDVPLSFGSPAYWFQGVDNPGGIIFMSEGGDFPPPGFTIDAGGYLTAATDPPTPILVYQWQSGDVLATCKRAIQAPPNNCSIFPAVPGTDFCVIDSEVEPDYSWSPVSGDFLQLSLGETYYPTNKVSLATAYTTPGQLFSGLWEDYDFAPEQYQYYPCGPVLPSSDPNNTEAYWTSAYNLALSLGMVPAGWVYGTDYPVAVDTAFSTTLSYTNITPTPITVGDAVSDLCLRSGMSSDQFDVSQLTTQLWGYCVARVTTGRDAITPLQGYGLFDAALSTSGVLRFIQRGGSSVATLTQDNIGASKGSKQKSATRLSTSRTADLELPQTVRLHFANTWNDYQDGMQPAQRLVTSSKMVKDIDLSAVAMAPNNAAQLADVWLRTTWIGREEPDFTLPADWLGTIQPGDPITLNMNGVSRRVRITDFEYSWPGLITVKSVRDESNAYTSIFVGATTATNSGPGASNGSVSVGGPTGIMPMDIPALQASDNQAGYYAAIFSYLSSWPGAAICRSTDGGASFSTLLSVSKEATYGITKNALGTWQRGWDYSNTITLKLVCGTPPASVSRTTLFSQSNVAIIGADGRWEMIQFQNATLNGDGTYTLSGLIRGLRGTDWAIGTHEIGDSFALLTGNIVRLNDSISYMGTTEVLKAVTNGTLIQDTTPATQVPREVCLMPLAPICFFGGRDSAGNLSMTWVRRDRFPNDLVDFTDIPMSESTEAYSIDIHVPDFGAVVRTIGGLSSPSAVYTVDQQIADFGSAQLAVSATVYQLSAIVGRGYGRQATL